MKILVGIPVITGYKHTMEAIDSVLNQKDVSLMIIDNNATPDIKELFKKYAHYNNFTVKVNENNIYVNPAWNQIMYAFLNNEEYKDYDLLCIMNSDLTMQNNWSDVLRNAYNFNPKGSYLPVVVNDCVKLERMKEVPTNVIHDQLKVVTEGTAGIFITLSREQVNMVYDIPETMKVWFGDNWIYGMLRGCGHDTMIVENLFAFHGLSQTVSRVENIDNIIAVDRHEWYNNVEPYLNDLIKKYNERLAIPPDNKE